MSDSYRRPLTSRAARGTPSRHGAARLDGSPLLLSTVLLVQRGALQGRELEQQVAAYFRAHGYEVSCNVILEGRSGGRHEVDVLAVKSDTLTTYRLAVECKAWQQPIEKDVVAKLHYILGDLALNKGIIVSLGGCRSGAERTAADLGIEIWGTEELRRHLGESAVGHVASGAGSAPNTGWGIPFQVAPAHAEQMVHTASRGRFNLRQLEQVAWFSPVWLPAYCVTMSVSQPGTKRLRAQVRSTQLVRLYDALGGSCLGQPNVGFEQIAIDPAIALPTQMRDSKVHASIRHALDGYLKVSTPAARERHAANAAAVGLPLPCTSLSIDDTSVVWLPYYVGVLGSGGQLRALAVNGNRGVVSDRVSDLLTRHLAVVRAHFTPRP